MAVIAHDFCDRLNTVGLMLLHGNAPRRAMAMLVLDAVQLYLGLLAGFLLYIGVSDILPEAHSRARRSRASQGRSPAGADRA